MKKKYFSLSPMIVLIKEKCESEKNLTIKKRVSKTV